MHTGVRRLLALIDNLPPDAAINAPHGWTQREELAALAVESSGRWGQAIAQLLAGQKTRLPPVLTIKRPGSDTSNTTSDPAAIRRFFGR